MGYKSFEELPVWNAAIDLAVRTLAMTDTGALDAYSGLRGQVERAAVSISNNIAEGFDRGTHEELLSFLYVARGSCAEARSMLHLLQRLPAAGDVREHLEDLLTMTDGVSRQLGAWIESLKAGDRRGPRYETGATRTARENARRAEAFDQHRQRIIDEAREKRRDEGQSS
jgi:four helix bundle protein